MKKLLLVVPALLCMLVTMAQANRTLTGKVSDKNGNGLSGVTVEANDRSATLTAEDGNFKIVVSPAAKMLLFTLSEYSSEQAAIGSRTVINITLTSNATKLQEVVVVGYGTQKRKEVTGNLSSVKGSEIASKPVQSFEQALAGKAAGVQITVPNGVLNNPPVFRIRGANSISLSSYPLIVVDGVPSYTGDQGATSAPANALASINPNDIESIDIAKDAAAAAIYGSRAANGVVFITTKKGKAGRAKINYDGWVGFSKAMRLPHILNAQQYVDYKNMAVANSKANNPAVTGTFIIPTDANGNPINTNWLDEVYRQGLAQAHNINVSGGSEGTSYYFSAGYTKQEGILRKNDFDRKNVMLTVDSKPNKVVSLGGKLSYSNERNLIGGTSGSLPGEAFASAGVARLAVALPPNVAPYNNNGTYNIASGTAIGDMGSKVNGANPYTFNNVTMLLNLNRSNNEVNHLQSNVYIQLKPLNWLTLKSVYGIDHLLIDNDIFYNPYHGDGAGTSLGPAGGGIASYSKDKAWIWTNTAQLDFTLGGSHNISVLAGNEQQRRTSVGFGIGRRTLSDSAFTTVQAGYVTNNPSGMTLGENFLLSYFGRLNYNYNKKYYLSGNVRQDEYSALGVKRGTFWGASAGWEVAQEGFWTSANLDNIFSSFKIRGSYGKVGNVAGIGNFASFSTYGSGFYGGLATLNFSSVGNPDITWETSKKTDIGLSFSILKDRVTFDAAYYKNNIDHLLLSVPQSPSTGLGGIFQNVGTMYNKGVEFTVTAAPVLKKNVSWNTDFNISYNKNMVTALANGLVEIQTQTSSLETVSKTLPGYSLGYLWVIRSAGVDPASGRRIFVNQDGAKVMYENGTLPAGRFTWTNPDGTKYDNPRSATNETINQADDAVLYANTQPKWIGGWNNYLKFMDFDVNIQFTYQFGFYVYYGSNAGLHDQRFWNNDVDVLGAWKKPGDQTTIPKPVFGDNVSNGSGMPMDINVFKGDFLKMKYITLGYTIPKSITQKAKINSIRAYVTGQNLWIKTKYPGPDPEVSSNGNSSTSFAVDRNTLANGRTITFGLNVNF